MCLLVVVLVSLRFLPTFSIGSYEVKSVDILSDLYAEDAMSGEAVGESAEVRRVKAAFRDSCPPGMVCIEDFSGDAGHGMGAFYEVLSQRAELGRPVRIAYFGDSFIEGDILTADLRDLLQKRFGGEGVGFVDIASPFTELRATIRHSAAGWSDHSALEKSGCDVSRLGLSCRYAVSGAGARVNYQGVPTSSRLDSFPSATLYLASRTPVSVKVKAGHDTETFSVSGSGRVECVTYSRRSPAVSFEVGAGATCYGVALEGTSGIVLDNFSLRGSSGTPLADVPEAHLAQMYRLRPYDLVVLQFGLNVASKNTLKYDYYIRRMKPVVERFKKLFPGAGILIVSIGDREDKVNGVLRTMPGVAALISAQQTMAAEEEVAFWNLYDGMGGEGSMRKMVEAKPAEAGKDYTHINRRGGRRIAGILYKTLVYGYEQYEKKRAYESE